MKSQPVRYGVRLGCRFGAPHDPMLLFENPKTKIERCRLCGKREVFTKGNLGRIDNVRYLKFHVRQLAQPNGSTKRVYAKVHNPKSLTIKV